MPNKINSLPSLEQLFKGEATLAGELPTCLESVPLIDAISIAQSHDNSLSCALAYLTQVLPFLKTHPKTVSARRLADQIEAFLRDPLQG